MHPYRRTCADPGRSGGLSESLSVKSMTLLGAKAEREMGDTGSITRCRQLLYLSIYQIIRHRELPEDAINLSIHSLITDCFKHNVGGDLVKPRTKV
jgi:hypothetical protein